MVVSSLKKYEGVLYPFLEEETSHGENATTLSPHKLVVSSGTPEPLNFISNDAMKGRVMVAMALSFLSGIIQIILGILHVGFVTKYLSDAIVNGFTCGAAYHVVVSQISTLLGIKLGDTHLAFVLVGVKLDMISNKIF